MSLLMDLSRFSSLAFIFLFQNSFRPGTVSSLPTLLSAIGENCIVYSRYSLNDFSCTFSLPSPLSSEAESLWLSSYMRSAPLRSALPPRCAHVAHVQQHLSNWEIGARGDRSPREPFSCPPSPWADLDSRSARRAS